MKILPIILSAPLSLSAQFLEPDWQGPSEHAQWDIFTEAKLAPNSPDVSADDATLTCTTSSAFLTSGGNIYSFQAATFFQINDAAAFPIRNVFLQIASLGSSIDLTSARIIVTNAEGETYQITANQGFIVTEEELTGDRGGIGTTYALQWDLSDAPITSNYSILFNAAESSLSLDQVSLRSSESFVAIPRPTPRAPEMTFTGGAVTLTWIGGGILKSSSSLKGQWTEVSTAPGATTVTLPRSATPQFFRIEQPSATE